MTDHECPGRCGRAVRCTQLACRVCWWRLPAGLRQAVNLAYGRRSIDPAGHRVALADALAWYRANPEAVAE